MTIIDERLQAYPNLQVYILTTPILMTPADRKKIEDLETRYPQNFHVTHAANVVVVWPDVTGIDNHVKMLIVDEHYYGMGGTNFDEALCTEGTYTPPRNTKGGPVGNGQPAGTRDQDMVGRGPLATKLRHAFYNYYAMWEDYNKTKSLENNPDKFSGRNKFFEIDPNDKPYVERFETSDRLVSLEGDELKVVTCGPHQKSNKITEEYVRLINDAKEEIVIGNLYFCPHESILKALMKAVNRGVKLTVVTNGLYDEAALYATFFGWANRMCYVPAFYGDTYHFWDAWEVAKKKTKNTRIFEYHVPDVLYHKKVMIVDKKTLVIGSYNLGSKSHLSDYEIIFVVNSEKAAFDGLKVIDTDLSYSKEVSSKQARDWYFNPATAFLGEAQKRFHGLL